MKILVASPAKELAGMIYHALNKDGYLVSLIYDEKTFKKECLSHWHDAIITTFSKCVGYDNEFIESLRSRAPKLPDIFVVEWLQNEQEIMHIYGNGGMSHYFALPLNLPRFIEIVKCYMLLRGR